MLHVPVQAESFPLRVVPHASCAPLPEMLFRRRPASATQSRLTLPVERRAATYDVVIRAEDTLADFTRLCGMLITRASACRQA